MKSKVYELTIQSVRVYAPLITLENLAEVSCIEIMKIWWPRVIYTEKLWEMTSQININKELRKR
jgi:hypothetical protein